MKDSRLKTWIQRFVLRTQFPPFVWLYRLTYAVALRLAVRGLRKAPGVRSIYLWRGLTVEAPLYGLSDIDLLILVADEDDLEPVQARYKRIARFLPMLAAEQCNAMSAKRFALLYKYDPVQQFRMEVGRAGRRLLFGEDLAADLPPITPAQLRTCIVWELRFVWIVLFEELVGNSSLSLFAKRFLVYKMVADFARLTMLAEGGDRPPARAEAYRRAPQELGDAAPMLGEIGTWRRKVLSPEPIPTEAVLDCAFALSRRILAAPLARPPFRRKVRLSAPNPATARMILAEEALDAMRSVRGLLPQVRRAVLVPRLPLWNCRRMRLTTGGRRGGWIDDFILVLIGEPRPSAKLMMEVSTLLAGFPREIPAVFQDRGLAIGWLHRPEVDFGARFDRPDLFPDLARTTPLGDGLELAGYEEWELAPPYADHFEIRAGVLLDRMESDRAAMLPLREYIVSFWELGRMALAVAQAPNPVVELPALSDQLTESLSVWTPDEATKLCRLHEEYALVVQGRPSQAETYKDWIRQYSRRLIQELPTGQMGPALSQTRVD